jgi:hypothetical protein
MILLAALACGTFTYLATGLLLAVSPLRRLGGPRGARRRAGHWQLWLDQAGARLSPRQFVTASIAAGMSLDRSLGELAEVGPSPIRVAFVRFPMLSRALGPVAALEVVKEELAHPPPTGSSRSSSWRSAAPARCC